MHLLQPSLYCMSVAFTTEHVCAFDHGIITINNHRPVAIGHTLRIVVVLIDIVPTPLLSAQTMIT